MHKSQASTFLLILIFLTVSCVQKKPTETTNNTLESKTLNPDASINNSNKKLKYTSGIWCILQDSKGNYWFGSHQEGACIFDGKSFTYFTIQDGLSDNQIRSIQEDQNGRIWFGTGNGLSSYDGVKITNHSSKNSFTGNDPISDGIWDLTANDLWFSAGNKSGVYRFNGEKLSYLSLPIQGDKPTFNTYAVTGFSKRNSHIWISTYAAAFRYDGKSFKTIDDESLGYSDKSGRLHIRSIFEDSKGRLWIGNNGIGVLLVDGNKTINFSEKKNLIHINSSRNGDPSPAGTLEHVFAIAEDSLGTIWFGDRDTGAWKYDGESIQNYTIDDKLPTQFVLDIYLDNKGALLFAMANGGVYIFNEGAFERKF
jgi:ligand-binding sensor domain-containing protein